MLTFPRTAVNSICKIERAAIRSAIDYTRFTSLSGTITCLLFRGWIDIARQLGPVGADFHLGVHTQFKM